MKKYNLLTQKYFMAFILSLFTLAGCYNNDLEPISTVEETNTCVISMKIPGGFSQTRAMSIANESKLDQSRLNILVFKKDIVSGEEQFAYKAPVIGMNLESDGKLKFSIKLVANTEGNNIQSRIVVVANHALTALPTQGQEKNAYLKGLTFESSAKWHAPTNEALNPRLFPMWGELANLVTVTEATTGNIGTVNLLRAIARIDVGLDYKTNSAVDENVNGLPGRFKLHSVHVFHTNNGGRVVPDATNLDAGKATSPTIPDNVTTKAFGEYLSYGEELVVGGNKMIREIYISEIKKADVKTKRHFLVIGGYYMNAEEPTYYRINFETVAPDASGGAPVVTELDILRNHNYRVNIKTVSGPGHTTPEDAANSIPANLLAEITPWDDEIIHMEVSGRYHFGVSARKISMEYKPGETGELKFFTNIPAGYSGNMKVYKIDELGNVASTPINISSSGTTELDEHFNIIGFNDNGMIFQTRTENQSEAYKQKLRLVVEDFKFDLELEQMALGNFFEFNCKEAVVKGVIKKGVSITGSNRHTITIQLDALPGVTLANNVSIDIETNEVDGIQYKGSCTFVAGQSSAVATLHGFGKTEIIKVKTFMIYPTNIASNATCHVNVRTALKDKLILTTSGGEAAWLLTEGGPAGRTLLNKYNFGTEDESIVPLENIFFDNCLTAQLASRLMTSPRPDVVITTYATSLGIYGGANGTRRITQALEEYVRGGGVLIYLQQEGAPTAASTPQNMHNNFRFISRLLDANTKNFNNYPSGGVDMQGTIDGLHNAAHRIHSVNDVILNGPFGDCRGKYWGQDQGYTNKLKFTTQQKQNDIIEYSTGLGVMRGGAPLNTYADHTTMMRMRKFNVFWVGDGGFVGSAAENNTAYTAFPFGWKSDPRNPGYAIAIPKPDRSGWNNNPYLYNSIVFMNAVTWGLEAAEYGWNKYDNDGNELPHNEGAPPKP